MKKWLTRFWKINKTVLLEMNLSRDQKVRKNPFMSRFISNIPSSKMKETEFRILPTGWDNWTGNFYQFQKSKGRKTFRKLRILYK